MKALRTWMKSSEEAREIFKGSQERAIPARVGDQMRDVILAMADVMEAAEQRTEFSSAPCIYCSYLDGVIYKMCDYHNALSAATSVIKEVTG